MNHDTIINLKAALGFAPENIGLRLVLARTLMDEKLFGEAEAEYRDIISVAPHSIEAKGGLAKAFIAQDKQAVAYVILEEICAEKATRAEFHVLFAKALLSENLKEQAAEQYRVAVSKGHRLQFGEVEYLFG